MKKAFIISLVALVLCLALIVGLSLAIGKIRSEREQKPDSSQALPSEALSATPGSETDAGQQPASEMTSVPTTEAADPAQTTDPAVPPESTEEPTGEATEEPTAEPTDIPEPTDVPVPTGDYRIRWQNAGERDYLPDEPVEMIDFSEMVYTRPDVEALCADFTALTERAADTEESEALLQTFFDLYDRYVEFYTMDTLANIHYSLDTTDTFYKDEYDYCEAQSPNLEEKLEALYKAFAKSPARDALEADYFGAGFFEKYDDYEVYTNETYLRLSQEEKQILSEYRDLTADPQVEYKGETMSLEEILDADSYGTYIGGLRAFYDQYTPLIGEKFIELVRIRKQIAETLGYDSYAAYCYDFTYGRDYTPEQGAAFVKDIETWLVPIFQDQRVERLLGSGGEFAVNEARARKMLESAAKELGGTVYDAYQFMEAYHLSDIAPSPKKLDASFETYLYAYEAPFVFVNSSGTSGDFITFSHEFGHFTDSYHNYNAEEDLETAETFSQAMEFLAICYTKNLLPQQKKTILQSQLADVLSTYLSQAAYASFEDAVYALPDDELTVERVNSLFLEANRNYGLSFSGFDFYFSQYWIDVIHFFEAPYYVISYCVSADTSLQVYELEQAEKGAGVAAYFRLLDRTYGAGVQQIMEESDMENPFEEGRMERTAAFFREAFGIPE